MSKKRCVENNYTKSGNGIDDVISQQSVGGGTTEKRSKNKIPGNKSYDMIFSLIKTLLGLLGVSKTSCYQHKTFNCLNLNFKAKCFAQNLTIKYVLCNFALKFFIVTFKLSKVANK